MLHDMFRWILGRSLPSDSGNNPSIRRIQATASYIAVGPSSPIPVVVVDIEPSSQAKDGADDAIGISEFITAGLMKVTLSAPVPDGAPGWAVIARPVGSDRLNVVIRSPQSEPLHAGLLTFPPGWYEKVADARTCTLLLGNFSFPGSINIDLSPEELSRAVGSAIRGGLVAGATVLFIPVDRRYIGEAEREKSVTSFGFSEKKRLLKSRRYPSIEYDLAVGSGEESGTESSYEDDSAARVEDALNVVRQNLSGLAREQVRQRLMEELLAREQMLPPRAVDYYVSRIMPGAGFAGKLSRWWRAAGDRLEVAGLALRSIYAMMLHRPMPHWHIMGIHMIRPSWLGSGLAVIIDPNAGKLIGMGERNEFEVWLGFSAEEKDESLGYSPVIVYRGEGRIGRLGAAGSVIYGSMLADDRHSNVIILTRARREKIADGSWSLRIAQPG